MFDNQHHDNEHNTLTALRALIPPRAVTFVEALRIAEAQAALLLTLRGQVHAPISSRIICDLPRLRVRRQRLPVAGATHWDKHHRCWVIRLNRDDPAERQRFTLAHEYAHIISHPATARLYTGSHAHTPAEQAEWAADHFASCLLVPKPLLEAAWISGLHDPTDLAEHFNVPALTVAARLAHCGLTRPPDEQPDTEMLEVAA